MRDGVGAAPAGERCASATADDASTITTTASSAPGHTESAGHNHSTPVGTAPPVGPALSLNLRRTPMPVNARGRPGGPVLGRGAAKPRASHRRGRRV